MAEQIAQTSPRDALDPYERLKRLSEALKDTQPAAEGAAPVLVDHVESEATKLFNRLSSHFQGDLQATLEKMKWPGKDLKMSSDLLGSWTEQVEVLLDLQEPDLKMAVRENHNTVASPIILLPLDVMIRPIELRFRYHFYGKQPTNRLDKPEYFLSHALDLTEANNDFLLDFLQPLLDKRYHHLDVDEYIYTDAVSSFITALLPMIEKKALQLAKEVRSNAPLFSHLVHELMSFDECLRDTWAYTPSSNPLNEWKGLTWSILTIHGYFNAWLEVEKNFALARYDQIIEAPDCDELDLDSTGPNSTKPTKGAIRVNDLLETITERYRSLSSFSQKMKFVIEIQIEIFDMYHRRMHGSFQNYLLATTRAGQILGGSSVGSSGEARLSGTRALESLCKVFGSAEYLEGKMSDWNEDVFFLELWDELQDRATRRTRESNSVGRDLDADHVASKTSASIARPGTMNVDGEDSGGALFDETGSAYHRLRQATEEEIIKSLRSNVHESMRPFWKISTWMSLSGSGGDVSDLSPSAALDGALQLLSEQLGFVCKMIGPLPRRRITRQVCQVIQTDTWERVLVKHSFSSAGAAQLRKDVKTIQEVVDLSIKTPGEASKGMRKLEEGLVLLGLPIKSTTSNASQEVAEGDEWDFDDERENAEVDLAEEETTVDDRGLGLWDVEREIFKSNESARQVLSRLGLELLTESEAREVLQKRV